MPMYPNYNAKCMACVSQRQQSEIESAEGHKILFLSWAAYREITKLCNFVSEQIKILTLIWIL